MFSYGGADHVNSTSSAALLRVKEVLAPQQRLLIDHDIYTKLTDLADIRVFMEHHVFAVWDFMGLLKALQRHLTCTQSSWRPVGTATTRRLINQMVLEEESDEVAGISTSHFELYLDAMQEAGASTRSINGFLADLEHGNDMESAFARSHVPAPARAFVRKTFEMIDTGKPHVICAAFTFGREQAVPGIFDAMLKSIPGSDKHLRKLSTYLERHIELDGEDHGPKSLAMLSGLCGDDARKWREALLAAQVSLDARLAFWSAVSGEVLTGKRRVPMHLRATAGHAPRSPAFNHITERGTV